MKKPRSREMKLSRLTLVLITFLLGWILILNTNSKVHAGGGVLMTFSVSASPTSTTVGNSVNLQFTGTTDDGYGDIAPAAGDSVYLKIVSGNGTVSPTSATADASGHASFTLTSSRSGSVTVEGCDTNGCGNTNHPATVNFTAPVQTSPPSTSTSASNTTPSAKTTTSSTSTSPSVPSPSISQLKIGSKVVSSTQPVTVETRQPLVLSGTTVANGTITLYIHSTLRTVTVTADKNGAWQYIVTNLPVGSHHIDAQVTDPVTKQQSAKVSLLDFTVKPSKILATVAVAKNVSKPWSIIAVSAVIALVVLGVAVYGWRRYRHKQSNDGHVTAAAVPKADLASEASAAETHSSVSDSSAAETDTDKPSDQDS